MKGRTARAEGGSVEEGVKVGKGSKPSSYTNTPNNVEDEASEPTGFKKGGKVEKDKMKMKMKKAGGKCEGDMAKARLDRPKRASGGKVASGSRSPFAESSKTSERPGFKGMSSIND